MKRNEDNKDPRKMTREEMNAEFERLLRQLSPADLQKVEDKILELMDEDQRAQYLAEKAEEEEARKDLQELSAKLSGFSIGNFTAFAVPKKGGKA